MRVNIIGHARIIYVGKYQSCMAENGRLIPHASYMKYGTRAELMYVKVDRGHALAAAHWRYAAPGPTVTDQAIQRR